jgi:hypothetical protein
VPSQRRAQRIIQADWPVISPLVCTSSWNCSSSESYSRWRLPLCAVVPTARPPSPGDFPLRFRSCISVIRSEY